MFLIPAFGAFTADVLVIYLNSKFHYLFENFGFWTIQNITYLVPLSITRLVFLIPYNYHTYSGTRLKLPFVYATVYVLSGIAVFAHFLAFSIYAQGNNKKGSDHDGDDENLRSVHEALFIDDENYDSASFTGADENNDKGKDGILSSVVAASVDLATDDSDDAIFTFDLIWILLTLSLCSISLHIVILLHVRSSAPSNDTIRRKFEEGQSLGSGDRKRKMLAYWVYDRYRRENDVETHDSFNESPFSSKLFKRNAVTPLSPVHSTKNGHAKFMLDPDLSISDDGDLSIGLVSSSDCDEYFDAEEGLGTGSEIEAQQLLVISSESNNVESTGNGISFDDDLHYFPTEDEPRAFDSPSISRRRRRQHREEDETPSFWRRRNSSSFRGLVDLGTCLSKQGYDDFLSEIRSRFQEAKREWDVRLEESLSRVRQNESGANASGNFLLQLRQHTPFRALLHLYAHEDVFLNKKLDRAFSIPDESALSFYAPQLLCFLLHNAYLSTGRLETWILEKCQTNTQFAHRCFWFLRAWCLQGGIYRPNEDKIESLSLKNSDSSDALNGHKQSSLISADNGAGLIPPSRNNSLHESSIHSFSDIKGLVQHPSEQDLKKTSGIKLSSEERNAVESLLSKIIECGEISTRNKEFKSDYEESDAESSEGGQPLESSPLHSGDTVSTNNVFSDVGCLTSPQDNHTLGLIPKTLSSVRLSQNGEEIQSYFLRTPDFLDSLMAIADDLIEVPRSNRTSKLRERLCELEANMLPSNSIYVPVNGPLHHVCRIVSSESFAISTKERVPCIIYLEVIDRVKFKNSDDNLSNWYKSCRPPQRHNTIFSKMTKGLKKLRHDIEENHDKLFGYSSSRDESLPLYTSELEINQSSQSTIRASRGVFKEDWDSKVERIRINSAFSSHPNWRVLSILIKTNDDIRQEQLAAQLIHCMATILSQARVPVWLYPYDIMALSFRGGIMEAIPDTISIDSLRKKHPDLDLKAFFQQQFGEPNSDIYENAKANFVESLAAYSIVCFLLQIKDRHNGNIMLDNKGHLVHIDFGFYFLSSPGKNSGFESAPFKLTRDFVELMDGANSHSFMKFRELCYRTFLELRRNCFQITLLVQMLIEGNEDLDCFRGRPHEAVEGLQERFRLDLNDKACVEYVNTLVDHSLENWTTTCYDRYQRCCVGIM